MSDREQLALIVRYAMGHSDFTRYGSDGQRIKRILGAVEERQGRVTVEDATRCIKSTAQLDEVMALYTGDYPLWLEKLARGVITGRVKLSGGNSKKSDGVDLLGLYDELRERFQFNQGDIYQALAEAFNVPGHSESGSNLAYSKGAEKVRQDIVKLRNQLPE